MQSDGVAYGNEKIENGKWREPDQRRCFLLWSTQVILHVHVHFDWRLCRTRGHGDHYHEKGPYPRAHGQAIPHTRDENDFKKGSVRNATGGVAPPALYAPAGAGARQDRRCAHSFALCHSHSVVNFPHPS